MFKILKLIITSVAILMLVLGGFFVYFNYIDKNHNYSATQIEAIGALGMPEQFAITYLPQGEEGERLIRQEVWFYPSRGKKLSFLGGELSGADDIEINNEYGKTQLKPADFDIFTDLDDIKLFAGEANLYLVEVPGFVGDGIETYASTGAVYVFDQGYLTYIETID